MSPIRKALMCGGASVMTLIATGAVFVPTAAFAQSDDVRDFNIPAGDLGQALGSFSAATGLQLVYSSELVAGLKTSGVSGRMSSREALARLLSGTGLSIQIAGNTATLIKVGSEGDERVLGAVRVQGSETNSGLPGSTPANGINGSRDVTATEGTGSYTSNALTVGSKVAASIKDTPMAVSVITNQQIQDRNLTDMASAMRDAPGVTVLNSDNDFDFWSRGFRITQVQIDGGAPQTAGVTDGAGYTYRPIIDMSLYDHVELVRGATGTFNAYGNPGGVINLVRKRPLDRSQMLLEMQLGSWNWHRVSADVTGPLAFGGRLRGRLIGTHQDNDYFYDVSHLSRNLVSATLELDISSNTLLTGGVNYQEQHGNAWSTGLPRFFDGRPLGLPRSAALVFPQAINDGSSVEYYGQLDQKFGPNWTITLKGTRSSQRSWQDLFAGAASLTGSGIDPVTHAGAQVAVPTRFNGRTKQTLLEATLNGAFTLFGQEQKIVLGANYAMGDNGGTGQYNSRAGDGFIGKTGVFGFDADVFNFDPNSWILTPSAYTIQSYGVDYSDARTLNAYVSADISPVKGIHINTALRYSSYRSRTLQWSYCDQGSVDYGICNAVGDKYYFISGQVYKGSDFSWPPSVSIRYDFNKSLSLYAAYTDIYQNRSQTLDRNQKPLPPITGMNLEGGVKWMSSNKKLNANLSTYYTKQIRTGAYSLCPDAALPCADTIQQTGVLNSQTSCCYAVDPNSYNKSYGVDVELTGEIRRGWQIAGSYTFNRNEQVSPGAAYFDGAARALQSQSPKHLFKIWSTYEFAEGTPLGGLRVGLGATGQSRTFVEARRCNTLLPFIGKLFFCGNPESVFFSDPGHIVVSGSLGYKINSQVRVDAELENLLDKTYYATVGSLGAGNWYGSPRSVKVTLRGKF